MKKNISLSTLNESDINFIGCETKLEGRFEFPDQTRIHGSLKGTLSMAENAELFIEESATVEGEIYASTLWISGFVTGRIVATEKISLSPTARVFGDLISPKIEISFGALFEGTSSQSKA